MHFKPLALLPICLLPTALATLSLNSIEPLTQDQVRPGCLNAYNAPINSCDASQIKSGSCTSACKNDLQTHGSNIILACRQDFVGPDSLLRRVMDNGIVSTLCKSPSAGGVGKDQAPQTSATGTKTDTATIGKGTMTVSIPTGSSSAGASLEVDNGPTPTVSRGAPTYTVGSSQGSSTASGDPFSTSSGKNSSSAGNSPNDAGTSGVSVVAGIIGVAAVVVSALVM